MILDHQYTLGSWNENTGQIRLPGYSYFTCPSGPPSNSPTFPWTAGWVHRFARNYAPNEYLIPYGRWSNSPVNYANEATAEAAYENGTYIPFPGVQPQNLQRPGSLILFCDVGVNAGENESPHTMWGPMVDGPNGIVNLFVSDPIGEQANGALPVTTDPAKDNDTGAGAGWPVYYRHDGLCNAVMADGHVQAFRNGEIQRRNFVSNGQTKQFGGPPGFIEASYP